MNDAKNDEKKTANDASKNRKDNTPDSNSSSKESNNIKDSIDNPNEITTPKEKDCLLIVDDDPDILDVLKQELSDEFKVTTSERAVDALFKLNNQKFSMLILDIHLPDKNGDFVVDMLRSDVKHFSHEIPIMVVSGHLDGEVITKIKSKVQGFLVKPFSAAILKQKVRTMLAEIEEQKKKNKRFHVRL